MAMHPRWTPSHPRARSTRRSARLTIRSAALAVGVVGSLAVAPHTANHEGLRHASLPNKAAALRVAMVSATEPVVLQRHTPTADNTRHLRHEIGEVMHPNPTDVDCETHDAVENGT